MNFLQILSNTAAQILAPATLGYALAAIGLSVHFGFAGLLNMGVAGFMAIGAYGFAISILTFAVPWPIAALIGLLASIVFALILGIPTLRLRGDYLAIVTIAAAEVLRLLFLTSTWRNVTGSADGLSGFQASFRASNPLPPGRWGFGPWTLPVGPMVGHHHRDDHDRDLRSAGVAAHAQPVGTGPPGHPRGRGCRALARQERLRHEDAGAHRRRHLHRGGRNRHRDGERTSTRTSM